jgi:hypothetical protein
MEARQKVPPFLAALQSENEKYLELGGELGVMLLLDTSASLSLADSRNK